MDFISLGINIKKLRNDAGLTQDELADKAGCSARQISDLENGKANPSLEIIVSIANTLGVGVDRLVHGDLLNRTDYYTQVILSLSEDFTQRDKLLSLEMTKSIVTVISQFQAE
jgi:transcriptional regulator with XRE-family HTH domain